MSKIDTWLKENHKDIYDEYLSSLENTKRERERVLFRTISFDEFTNYIVNSNLNGAVTKQNRSTWNTKDEKQSTGGGRIYSDTVYSTISENNPTTTCWFVRNINGVIFTCQARTSGTPLGTKGYIGLISGSTYYDIICRVYNNPKTGTDDSLSYQTYGNYGGNTYYNKYCHRPVLNYKDS